MRLWRSRCWEMFASSRAALRFYAEGGAKTPVRAIEDLLRLAEENDKYALDALTRQAEYIGRGLRLICATLAPEMILIAGDIVSSWPRFGPSFRRPSRPPFLPASRRG